MPLLKYSLIWIIGFSVALVAALAAMGAVAKNKAPELAISLQPTNGYAAEKIASNAIIASVAANQGQFPDQISPAVIGLAKRAFLAEPVTPAAVTILALNRPLTIKRKLIGQAFALSRREHLTNGWLVADSGVQQDISGILNYYDVMLRTSSASGSVVIPVMAKALSNEKFIAPFGNLLSHTPPWASQFWAAVAADPEAVVNGAALRSRVFRKNESKDIYRDADLIAALINNQHFGTAEALYNLFSPKPPANELVRDSSFTREPIYAPLDWQLFSTGEYGSAINRGSLQLSAIQNSGGLLARQLVKIPPAIVDISAKANDTIPDDVDLAISLTCAEKGDKSSTPIKFRLTEKSTVRQISNQRTGCRYYWVDLSGRASADGAGFDIALMQLSIKKK
jgi:hypothetical protein